MRYTKDDSRAYAQQRANDTGSPYMVVSVVGIDDLWYSMLDCPHNLR